MCHAKPQWGFNDVCVRSVQSLCDDAKMHRFIRSFVTNVERLLGNASPWEPIPIIQKKEKEPITIENINKNRDDTNG